MEEVIEILDSDEEDVNALLLTDTEELEVEDGEEFENDPQRLEDVELGEEEEEEKESDEMEIEDSEDENLTPPPPLLPRGLTMEDLVRMENPDEDHERVSTPESCLSIILEEGAPAPQAPSEPVTRSLIARRWIKDPVIPSLYRPEDQLPELLETLSPPSRAGQPNFSPRPGTSSCQPQETNVEGEERNEDPNEDQGRVSTPELAKVVTDFYAKQGKTNDKKKTEEDSSDESLHLELSSDED